MPHAQGGPAHPARPSHLTLRRGKPRPGGPRWHRGCAGTRSVPGTSAITVAPASRGRVREVPPAREGLGPLGRAGRQFVGGYGRFVGGYGPFDDGGRLHDGLDDQLGG